MISPLWDTNILLEDKKKWPKEEGYLIYKAVYISEADLNLYSLDHKGHQYHGRVFLARINTKQIWLQKKSTFACKYPYDC